MRLLTLARDLRRRKSRERHALFVAEGVRAVEELLHSTLKVHGILTAPQLQGAERGLALVQRVKDSGVEMSAVTEAEFRSAAETESPQGVLAIAEIPEHRLESLAGAPGLRLLVLDAVQDPGNVGTILRTAAALGVSATIALPGTVDPWNAKVVRAAMGATFRRPVIQCAVDDLLQFLEAGSIPLWGAETGGEPVSGTKAPPHLAIAVGNEGAGLSSKVRDRAVKIVSIPVANDVESLNVAVATGILIHELFK